MRTVDLHSHGWFQSANAGPERYKSVVQGIADRCFEVSLHITAYTEVLCSPYRKLKEAALALDSDYKVDDLGIAFRIRRDGSEAVILKSQEVHTRSGHILVIGSRETFPDKKTLKDSILRAKDTASLLIAPHPFVPLAGIGENNLEEFIDDFDAIEVFNAQASRLGPGRYLDMYRANLKARSFAERRGKPGIAASDSHSLQAIGSSYIITDEDMVFRDGAALLESLRKTLANRRFRRKEKLSGRLEVAKWAAKNVYFRTREALFGNAAGKGP